MKSDPYDQICITELEAFEAIYQGKIKTLDGIFLDDANVVDQYNRSVEINADRVPFLSILDDMDISIESFDNANQLQWFMPNDYCPNLVEMLYEKCTTEEQRNRVSDELDLYIKYKMFDLLYYLKYLVDTMRENNIVWGVGRGSSVSSYVLFLIGIHRVDSLKFSLDIHEFLK